MTKPLKPHPSSASGPNQLQAKAQAKANGSMCQPTPDEILDQELMKEVQRAMREWGIPNCVIVLVQPAIDSDDDEGYKKCIKLLKDDVEGLGGGNELTLDTSFSIGSASKIITAYALHLALTRAGLSWVTRVKEIIPDFHVVADASISDGCTMKDLLSHRSGLGGWHVVHGPQMRERSIVDIVNHLPPASGFREAYNYASTPYHLAAHVIEILDARLSELSPREQGLKKGQTTSRSFVRFVQDEILRPLGMLDSGYRKAELIDPIQGYAQLWGKGGDGKLLPMVVDLEMGMSDGSGGLWMTARDLETWLIKAPSLPDFEDLFDTRITAPDEMGPSSVVGGEEGKAQALMQCGLGTRRYWRYGVEIRGMHGTTPTFASQTVWFPESGTALGILANAGDGGVQLRQLIECRVAERLSGRARGGVYGGLQLIRDARREYHRTLPPLQGVPPTDDDIKAICGTWKHPSFPDIVIAPSDIIGGDTTMELSSVPYLPFLSGYTRCIFALQREADADILEGEGITRHRSRCGTNAERRRFSGCIEVRVGSKCGSEDGEGDAEGKGKAYHGLSFSAELLRDKMKITGWADEPDGVVAFKRETIT